MSNEIVHKRMPPELVSDGVPSSCTQISKGSIMDELWSSPKKRTGVAHVREFVTSIFSNTFCLTLCFFLFVEPVKVPHSEQGHQDAVAKHVMDIAVARMEKHTQERGIPLWWHAQCGNVADQYK
jgi:hypothetical protein